jgi:peptidoglycan/xylan/chitin deacetylase (PgdA/CDA1 family)
MSIRERLRGRLPSAAQCLGLNTAFRTCMQKRLLVLCYHEVVPDELSRDVLLYDTGIGVTEFSRQIEELTRLFQPISVAQLRNWRTGNGIVPRNPVLVTFDDGYRNNLTYAAPVLQKFGIPALINICTGYVGQKRMLWPHEIFWRVLSWPKRVIPMPGNRREVRVSGDIWERMALAYELREFCKRLPGALRREYLALLREYDAPPPNDEVCSFLSWEELRILKDRGFEVGSHSVEHPILTLLDRGQLDHELRDSKRVIEEQTGGECICFAYPNGGTMDISSTVTEAVHNAGYSFAFVVTGRLASASADPFVLDRVHVQGAISLADFQSRISGFRGMLKQWLGVVGGAHHLESKIQDLSSDEVAKVILQDAVNHDCAHSKNAV